MSNTVISQLKQHVIERVQAEDWRGAMNLLDAILLVGNEPTQVSQTPPQVEQVPDNEKPQATYLDEERLASMNKKNDNLL